MGEVGITSCLEYSWFYPPAIFCPKVFLSCYICPESGMINLLLPFVGWNGWHRFTQVIYKEICIVREGEDRYKSYIFRIVCSAIQIWWRKGKGRGWIKGTIESPYTRGRRRGAVPHRVLATIYGRGRANISIRFISLIFMVVLSLMYFCLLHRKGHCVMFFSAILGGGCFVFCFFCFFWGGGEE